MKNIITKEVKSYEVEYIDCKKCNSAEAMIRSKKKRPVVIQIIGYLCAIAAGLLVIPVVTGIIGTSIAASSDSQAATGVMAGTMIAAFMTFVPFSISAVIAYLLLRTKKIWKCTFCGSSEPR